MPSVKLKDEEIELAFSMPAIARLNAECGVNLYSPDTYNVFPPDKLVALVWAAQLHRGKKALTREQIAARLPMPANRYLEVCTAVSQAVNDAIQDDNASE